MIIFLRGFFLLVLASMLWVTAWASRQCPLFALPPEVFHHPWFVATLFDAYWGFLTFFVWVCSKQTSWLASLSWFIAILLLGNIAMSAYCLNELWRLPRDGSWRAILTEKRSAPGILGPLLAGLGVIVVAVGWTHS